MTACNAAVMEERLNAALAALQRVEEILYANEETTWGRSPETQAIRDAIADVDTMDGAWDPTFGSESTAGTYVLSTRRPGAVSTGS